MCNTWFDSIVTNNSTSTLPLSTYLDHNVTDGPANKKQVFSWSYKVGYIVVVQFVSYKILLAKKGVLYKLLDK